MSFRYIYKSNSGVFQVSSIYDGYDEFYECSEGCRNLSFQPIQFDSNDHTGISAKMKALKGRNK